MFWLKISVSRPKYGWRCPDSLSKIKNVCPPWSVMKNILLVHAYNSWNAVLTTMMYIFVGRVYKRKVLQSRFQELSQTVQHT